MSSFPVQGTELEDALLQVPVPFLVAAQRSDSQLLVLLVEKHVFDAQRLKRRDEERGPKTAVEQFPSPLVGRGADQECSQKACVKIRSHPASSGALRRSW